MKKIIFLFTLTLITTTISFAQTSKFNDAMRKTLNEMDTLNSADEFMAIANKFERVALAEKTQWLPYYYSALARCTAVFMYNDNSKTDAILDVAEKHAKTADSLMPNNSEIFVLKSMVLGGRIMVDPMTRGQQYGMQSMMMMNQAMTLDLNNPRSYYIMGQSLFYTPPQFGGGQDKGCAMIATSKEKFAIFKPASDIHPNWGEDQVNEALLLCKPVADPVKE